jgi:hypothetical protein
LGYLDNRIKDLYGLPQIEDSKDPEIKLLAIILQNGFHDRNHQRTGAIEEGKYHDISKMLDAKNYLGSLLFNLLNNKLKGALSELRKKFQNVESDQCAADILASPD